MSDMMKDPMVLRQIIMDHYQYPRNHQLTKAEGYVEKHMASDSCIDDIYVQGKVEDGVVQDIRFDGEACTISTASTASRKGSTARWTRSLVNLTTSTAP